MGAYCVPETIENGFDQEGALPPFIVHTQASKVRDHLYKKIYKDSIQETVHPVYTSGLYECKHDS